MRLDLTASLSHAYRGFADPLIIGIHAVIKNAQKESDCMIQLTDNLAIFADEHQYILATPRASVSKDGKPTTRMSNPRYFSTLTTALKQAVALSVRSGVADGSITALRDCIDLQQRLQDEFSRKLKPLDI